MLSPTAIFAGPVVHQIGYATSDLKEAMRRYRDGYGVRDFMVLDDNVTEIAPGRTATISVAMGFVRGTMIELIEPRGGADGIYRDVLPSSGFAVRQHHLGYAVHSESEWEAAEAQARRLGLGISLEGESPAMRYRYLDTRADLGHYIEHLYYLGEVGAQLLAAVPRND